MSALLFTMLLGFGVTDACGEVKQYEEAKLLPWSGPVNYADFFGISVALQNDWALIGAPFYTTNVEGRAYIFRQDQSSGSWLPYQELEPSSGGVGDEFGYSVALCEEVALVVANKPVAGFVFRYDPNTTSWVEEALLLPDTSWGNFPKCSVALDDGVAIIGVPRHAEGGIISGAVFVYRYDPMTSAWEEEPKLLASDREAGDQFGCSVALHGDVALIGAYFDDKMGSAYVFRYDSAAQSWTEEAKLRPTDTVEHDDFGFSVALSQNAAMVGAPWHLGMGSAYLFRHDAAGGAWIQETKLTTDPGGIWNRYGSAVELSGDMALVGEAYGEIGSGVVHLYRYLPGEAVWRKEVRLLPSEAGSLIQFGHSVALHEGHILVGEPGDTWGSSKGAAYVYNTHTLYVTDDELHQGHGSTIYFNLSAGAANAHRRYIVLGSLSGTEPGTVLPGGMATLPLNWDAFTDALLPYINTPTFLNAMGMLNGYGNTTATLNLARLDPKHIGLELFFAACLDTPFDFTTNPVTLTVVP